MADIEGIYIRNFCGIGEAELVLEGRGLCQITGENRDTSAANSNGAGKTTLFKALTWCLYEQTVDGDSKDEVIRRGQTEAEVTVTLNDQGERWIVTRRRRKGSPSLELIGPSGEKVTGPRSDIQARIVDLMGLDFHAFKNTVLFGQNDAIRFADPRMTDSQRKEILHRILRIEVLKEAEGHVRERLRGVERELAKAEAEAEVLRSRMEEHDPAALEKEREAWEEEREARANAAAQKAREALESAKEIRAEAGDVEALRAAVSEAEAAVERAKKKVERREALRERERRAADAVSERERAVTEARSALREAERALDRLDGDACPVCTSPLTDGRAAEHLAALREARDAAAERLEAAREEAAGAVAVLEEIRKRLERLRGAEREGAEATRELAAAQRALGEAERAEERAEERLERAREWNARAKEIRAEVNPVDAQIKKARARIEEIRGQLKEAEARHAALAREAAHLRFWVKGFGSQGLPSFLLDSAMPYLTERANHYLEILTDGDITMKFSSTSETSAGETRDKIGIEWVIEGIPNTTPSGGQRKRMEIATELALTDLAASREVGRSQLLLMDEVLDGLDREGKERVIQLLHELRSTRSSVFVITHESDLGDAFDHVVHVTKEAGVARIEEVS